MKLYHGSQYSTPPDGVLIHLGSLSAATTRLISAYMIENPLSFDGSSLWNWNDPKQPRKISAEDNLNAFAQFMERSFIHVADTNLKSPLRLKDCWSNDPIGSAGMGLFDGNTEITNSQRKQLTKNLSSVP